MTSHPHSARTGVLLGGSGLIGGTLLHHYKTRGDGRVRLLAPNSKELSLRVAGDVRAYFESVRPDFVINCAIASIDADPRLTFEVTCRGSLLLARAALELGIPYIHMSSAAVLPHGCGIREEQRLPLDAKLPNYAKGKLMAELALERMHRELGLDYTAIRLAVVYGAHDHKVQGFHRLLFSLVEGSMPLLFTTRSAAHSYTNARKLPHFVEHVLDRRQEFSGETLHFVDPDPVSLGQLILTIKSLLGTPRPRTVYVPYGLARLARGVLSRLVRMARRVGLAARAPAELVFLENFYRSQILCPRKLSRSSWVDPDPGATVFSALPELLDYYVRRWEGLNLIEHRSEEARGPEDEAGLFARDPARLLAATSSHADRPLLRHCPLPAPAPEGRQAAAR